MCGPRLASITCPPQQAWHGWEHPSLHMAGSWWKDSPHISQTHSLRWLLITPFHTCKPDFQGARRQMSSADSKRALITLAHQHLPVPLAHLLANHSSSSVPNCSCGSSRYRLFGLLHQ